MGGEDSEHSNVPAVPTPPSANLPDRARGAIEGQFRVLWRPLQWLRPYWWAIGAYIAYCTAIWALAALAGWVL